MASILTGLYLGGDSLCGISLRPAKKGWQVVGGGVAPADAEAMGPSMKAAYKSARLSGNTVGLCLPKQQAIVRNVTLPSSEPAELGQMARFEAERHIPFHAERHSIGHHVMRSMGVEGSEVLIGAMDGAIVQRALDGAVAAGLRPAGVTLSSVALVNSLLYAYPDQVHDKTLALIAIGLEVTDLVLVSGGRVIFARSVTTDLRSVLESWSGHTMNSEEAQRPDPARLAMAARMIDATALDAAGGSGGSGDAIKLMRGWLERLVQEVRRTYDFARREMKCPPIESIVLTGEGAALRNLKQYLYVNLNAEIELLNPVGGLPGAKERKLPFEGLELVVPFGAAIAGELEGAYRLDLTPDKYYRTMLHRRLARKSITTGILAVFALGLGVAAWMRADEIHNQTLEAYLAVNEQLQPEVEQLSEMRTKLKIIRRFLDDKNGALKVLDSVVSSRTIPQQVTLTRFNYQKDKNVTIEGEAKTIPAITDFQADLDKTKHFTAPVREENRQTGSPGGYHVQVYTFSLAGEMAKSETKPAAKSDTQGKENEE